MKGISVSSGKDLDGINHLKQSIRDILTTRKGTRVMRRDYGSDVPSLLDSPMSRQNIGAIYAATAEALDKWEPRLRLNQVFVSKVTKEGELTLALDGVYQGKPVSLTTDVAFFG